MNETTRILLVVIAIIVQPFATRLSCADNAPKQDQFEMPTGRRQLFLDGLGIEEMTKLTRTMHQPAKKGAVIEPDQPWESLLQIRCAPAWDEKQKRYKIWLVSAGPGFSRMKTGYAESLDGLRWTKPSVDQVEINGSRKNNLLSLGSLLENVVYDPHDPDPARRFKGLLGTNGRQPVVSSDGITWKKLSVPILPSQDESNLSYDPQTRQFIATLKQGGPNGRSVTLTTSKDFEQWSKTELVFHTDDDDQRRAKTNIQARLSNPKLRNPLFNNTADYNSDIYNMECDCSSGAGLDVARNGWFSAGSYDSATEVLPIGTHRQLP